jgi:hypothetical protein
MSLTVRRVVTGHDENGCAIVSIDIQRTKCVVLRQFAAGGEGPFFGFIHSQYGRRRGAAVQ